MDMFEEARAIHGTMELCGATQGEMARRLGVSQSYIANKLRLLQLDADMRERIIEAGLTERHARTLLRLKGEQRREALKLVCDGGLNVAETEALVSLLYDGEAPKRIGRAEKHRRVDTFFDTLRESVRTLRSLGVDAKQTVSRYGGKTFVTVVIGDEGD